MRNLKDFFEFYIGDIVYLKTDKDQCERMITAINIKPSGVQYALSCGPTETWHYDIEISDSVNVLIKSHD